MVAALLIALAGACSAGGDQATPRPVGGGARTDARDDASPDAAATRDSSSTDGAPDVDASVDAPTLTDVLVDRVTGADDVKGPDVGDASIDAVAACAMYADVYCSRFRECYPNQFRGSYDTLDVCKSAQRAVCPQQFTASGTSRSPSSLRACAVAMMGQECAAWIADAPPECAETGTLPNGAGCEYDAQCQGGFCNRCQVAACDTAAAISHCGKCQAKVGIDGVCDPRQKSCERGLRCVRGSNPQWVCVPRAVDAGACTEYYDCPLGYYCSSRTCVRARQLGEPCTSSACDFVGTDLSCAALPNDAGFACAQTTWVGQGQACNFQTATLCAKDGTCMSGGVPANSGTCSPAAVDGAPCGFGMSCPPPSLCVSGTCQPPVPAASCQ